MSDPPPATVPIPKKLRRPVRPGLLRRQQAARYCGGVGVSTWDKWNAAGLTPAPIKLGGAVLWSRRELKLWIDFGCPPRDEWEHLWHALRAGRSAGRAK